MTHQFSLDRSVFEELSLVSGSTDRLEFFNDERLSGQQRLFFQVWASQVLQVGVLGAGHTLTQAGEIPLYGYVTTSGEARRQPVSENSQELLLGPGSVLGLAEGLAGIPSLYTVEAISTVHCKVISIDEAHPCAARPHLKVRPYPAASKWTRTRHVTAGRSRRRLPTL